MMEVQHQHSYLGQFHDTSANQISESSNDNTVDAPIEETTETYQSLIEIVIEQEARLNFLENQNKHLIPDHPKRTNCVLSSDQESLRFFSNGFKTSSNTIRMSFSNYLSQRRCQISLKSILKQCSQLMSYLKNSVEFNGDFSEYLIGICTNRPTLFNEYFTLLREQNLKPSTILTRINSSILLIDYLRMVNDTGFRNLTEMIERLERERTFYQTIATRENQQKTKEVLLKKREWIPEGIFGLQKLMEDSWPYYDALVRLTFHTKLTVFQYSWAIGYTLASLWVFAVNARGQSIENMRMKDWKEISTYQFHLSEKFKTSSTYKYQIVASTDILKLYVRYIRPQIIPADIDSDEAFLFPNSKGSKLASGELSRKISNTFKVYGYHFTVTRLRDMISTHIADLHRDQKITHEEYKNFVLIGQNHALATHSTFYDINNPKRKYEQGTEIQQTFQKVKSSDGELTESTIPSFEEQMKTYSTMSLSVPKETMREIMEEIEFGSAREDINKVAKRYDWLDQEIEYLKSYILDIEPTISEADKKNRYATCLNHIKKSTTVDVKKWFHPFHVESSGRLKSGFERALTSLE